MDAARSFHCSSPRLSCLWNIAINGPLAVKGFLSKPKINLISISSTMAEETHSSRRGAGKAVHRRESQFPTATFALKSFFGLLLGSCASAAWTLHRAHLCQRAVRRMECGLHGSLLQSTSHRHPTGCYSVSVHFRFHDANGEVSPAKSIS